MSVLTSGLLLINGLQLYTKIREFSLMFTNHKKIIWKKTIVDNKNFLTSSAHDHGDEENNGGNIFNNNPNQNNNNIFTHI